MFYDVSSFPIDSGIRLNLIDLDNVDLLVKLYFITRLLLTEFDLLLYQSIALKTLYLTSFECNSFESSVRPQIHEIHEDVGSLELGPSLS